MITRLQEKITGSRITRATSSIWKFRAEAGTISRLDFYVDSPLGPAVVDFNVFNFRINGVAQFVGAARPQLGADDTGVAKTGLSIAVSDGDVLAVDLEVCSAFGFTLPAYFRVTLENGETSIGALNDLTDVDADTPADGDRLVFDSGSGKWVPVAASAVPTALNDLTDVDAAAPSTGDVLTFDGANWINNGLPFEDSAAFSDETTALTTGQKLSMFAKRAFTLTDIWAGVGTVSSSGAITIDVKKNGSTIFSTKITIDASENTSLTATTPFALTGTITFAKGDIITVHVDGAGTGAKGGKIYFEGQ